MEIKLLKACNHKNIIKLLSSSSEASEGSQQRGAKDFYLLFPFIEESAYNVIEKNVQKGRNYDYSNVNSYQSPYSEVRSGEQQSDELKRRVCGVLSLCASQCFYAMLPPAPSPLLTSSKSQPRHSLTPLRSCTAFSRPYTISTPTSWSCTAT